MTDKNPKLDVVDINACITFGEILTISSQDIEWKRKSYINNSVTNLRKMTRNNPNQDFFNINANTKLSKILSISSQQIE